MQGKTEPPCFEAVERNLRAMFRAVAAGKPAGEVRELPGLTIASSGARFQMFNAAFLNSPVSDAVDLDRRILLAQTVFNARKLSWALWICEELLAEPLRKRLVRICQRQNLHLASEMPAMLADRVPHRENHTVPLEILPVASARHLADFCKIGAACFRVPPPWFEEIYDRVDRLGGPMRAWVGYWQGQPVCTVATVESEESVGIYNLATLPAFRQRGFGEGMLRHALQKVGPRNAQGQVVLQSTMLGLRLYERLGFRGVGRILVFPSR